ncbi:hypothetical protein IW262DRAFT_1301670 [Armillaria fumosa]|nr:hypothetical protein IW262DRAFT_1301670 [Armillaria fumosa]
MHSVPSEVLRIVRRDSREGQGGVIISGLMVPGRTIVNVQRTFNYSVSRRHDDSGVRMIEMRLKFDNILEIKPDKPGSVVMDIRCGVAASRDGATDRGLQAFTVATGYDLPNYMNQPDDIHERHCANDMEAKPNERVWHSVVDFRRPSCCVQGSNFEATGIWVAGARGWTTKRSIWKTFMVEKSTRAKSSRSLALRQKRLLHAKLADRCLTEKTYFYACFSGTKGHTISDRSWEDGSDGLGAIRPNFAADVWYDVGGLRWELNTVVEVLLYCGALHETHEHHSFQRQ